MENNFENNFENQELKVSQLSADCKEPLDTIQRMFKIESGAEVESKSKGEYEKPSEDSKEVADFNEFRKVMAQKYGTTYAVVTDFEIDDDTTMQLKYCFKKPLTHSYDRYVQGLSKSPTKASRAFVLDNIVEEQRAQIIADLEVYPAIAIGISDKLLGMLGLGNVTLKKL